MEAGHLATLTDGAIAGTGTIELSGYVFGGVDINADGTNAAVVVIRDQDATGVILLDSSTISGKTIFGPFRAPSGKIYYSISGTGATATLYEWKK